MKIALNKLLPNPFRVGRDYPTNEAKVEQLIASIRSTGFWDNLLARPAPRKPGFYELAYGWHRWQALLRFYPDSHEIDIPVRDLSDRTMLRILANENASDWDTNTAVILATLRRAKEYLRNHPDEFKFASVKGKNGSEPHTDWAKEISAFLDGVFYESMVVKMLAVLNAIDNNEVDARAVNLLETPTRAYEFTKEMRSTPKPIAPDIQRRTAREIKNGGLAPRDIKARLHIQEQKQNRKEQKPDLREWLARMLPEIRSFHSHLLALVTHKQHIPTRTLEWLNYRTECVRVRNELDRLLVGERKRKASKSMSIPVALLK